MWGMGVTSLIIVTSRPVSYTHLDVYKRQGLPGESHDVVLELKLLADVGLVGFPNVGKSTLLSVVSKACLLYTSRCV